MFSYYSITWVATAFYLLAFLASLRSKSGFITLAVLLLPALAIDALTIISRYWYSLPMMPMYAGSMALPFCLGIVCIALSRQQADFKAGVQQSLLFSAALISAVSLFFPKDFYLPFLKSATISAHMFLGFGTAGKACFLVSSAWAFSSITDSFGNTGKNPRKTTGKQAFNWAIWGFALFTVSMFAGELWSYRVWGTPVVWDDPAITTTMATWFFYVGFLHLHLTGSWSIRERNMYATAGAVAVFLFNIIPDTGPFRWPF